MTDIQLLNRIRGPCTPRTTNMDTIAYLLDRDIYYFRIASFENYSLEISLAPSVNASKAHDTNGNFIGYDSYDLGVYSRTPESVSARISPSDSGAVEIMGREDWGPVSTLLNRLEATIDWNAPFGNSRYQIQMWRAEHQQRWWAANGKTFKFLNLPAEVREMIYEYAVGPKVEPYPRAKTRKLGDMGCAGMVARMANTNLLFTCKFVYREASDILFRRTTFFVDRVGILMRLLQNELQGSRIRRLELALSHLDYFKLFGMRSVAATLYTPKKAACQLQDMQLDWLTFRLAAPRSTTSEVWLDNACQKVAVNWILEEAWPFVRKHAVENVLDIKGYVKKTSRWRFDSRVKFEQERVDLWQQQRIASGQAMGEIKQYYEELDEEDGGYCLDPERSEDERMLDFQKNSIPLRCECTTACNARPWRAKDYP